MSRWEDDRTGRDAPYDPREENWRARGGGYEARDAQGGQWPGWQGQQAGGGAAYGQGESYGGSGNATDPYAQHHRQQQGYDPSAPAYNSHPSPCLSPQPYPYANPAAHFNPLFFGSVPPFAAAPPFYPSAAPAPAPHPSPSWQQPAPFYPTPPAYAPPPAQGGGGGGWGAQGGGGDWRDGRDGRGRPGGRDPWSTGDYRAPRRPRDRERERRSLSPRRAGEQQRNPRERRWDSRSPSPEPYNPSAPSLPSRSPPRGPAAEQTDQGYTTLGAYDAQGGYVAPKRRVKQHVRSTAVGEPTATYLAAAASASPPEGSASVSVEQLERGEGGPEPPLLILDLNHTLLCRAKRTSWGSRQPLARPYLATFLEYICSSMPPTSSSSSPSSAPSASSAADDADADTENRTKERRPRFFPIVYSSARSPNVLSMLAALSLIPPARLPPSTSAPAPAYNFTPFSDPPYEPKESEGDVLRVVFTREMMGLSKRDYDGDVETTKDVARVWEELGWGGLREWKLAQRAEAASLKSLQAQEEAEEEARNPDEIYIAEDVEELDGEGAGEAQEGKEGKEVEGGEGKKEKIRTRPNKKNRARMDQLRDEMGARRTLLLDDEASKAAQQPFSHLPLPPFIVPAASFPPPLLAPPLSPRSASLPPSQRPFLPPPLSALELPPDSTHPAASDTHLLSVIFQLERLRCESNIAAAIRGGLLGRLREEIKGVLEGEGKEGTEREVDERMAEEGRRVAEGYGIEVRRGWDEGWRERLLRREGRLPSLKEDAEKER
ncbi:hypothetical protein JCM10213_003069 [Rhodosporidiobolus nylandii]